MHFKRNEAEKPGERAELIGLFWGETDSEGQYTQPRTTGSQNAPPSGPGHCGVFAYTTNRIQVISTYK